MMSLPAIGGPERNLSDSVSIPAVALLRRGNKPNQLLLLANCADFCFHAHLRAVTKPSTCFLCNESVRAVFVVLIFCVVPLHNHGFFRVSFVWITFLGPAYFMTMLGVVTTTIEWSESSDSRRREEARRIIELRNGGASCEDFSSN